MTSNLSQPPPTLPGFEPVSTVTELPQPGRRKTARPEPQPSLDDTTTMLVEASDKICRALRTQIAHHEAQAQRLRKALEQFASIPAAPEAAMGTHDALTELLAIAQRLPAASGD